MGPPNYLRGGGTKNAVHGTPELPTWRGGWCAPKMLSFGPRITYVERSGPVSREVRRARGWAFLRGFFGCRCWLHVEWPGLVSTRWADGARGNDCVHDDDEDDVAANVDDCAAAVVRAIGGKGRWSQPLLPSPSSGGGDGTESGGHRAGV